MVAWSSWLIAFQSREGNDNPLQYPCLENPMDGEPGRLQSMGSQRVGHDWATSLSLFTFMHRRGKWQPTPVFLPGESQGWRSLVGYRLCGLHRVRHDWSDLAAVAAAFQRMVHSPWERPSRAVKLAVGWEIYISVEQRKNSQWHILKVKDLRKGRARHRVRKCRSSVRLGWRLSASW